MWASRRRAITFCIIISVIGVFVVLPYWWIHREVPTCNDGKRNQNEQGIDCGGACRLVCPGGAKDITVLWTKVFPVRAGVYDVVAYAENANQNIVAPVLPYVVKLYDADNNVIAQESDQTFAAANERFAIFKGNIHTGEKVAVKGSVELAKKFRWYTEVREKQKFIVDDKVLVGADSKPKLTALLKNDSPELFRDIDITAIIYDAKGSPIGVSSTHVDKIDKNGSEKLFFTWPTGFNYVAETSACEVPVDVVLAVDRSGSMAEAGKLASAKSAAQKFVDRLTSKDEAGYVTFATEASNPVDQTLTNEMDRVKRAIDKTEIKKNDGLQFTNIGGGILRSLDELATFRHNEASRPVIILLTDGLPTRPEDPSNKANKEYPTTYAKQFADEAKKQGVGMYTIGLGEDVNSPLLESLSTSPNYYYKAASGAELGEVYQQIATAMCKKGPSVIEIIPRVNNVR